MHTFLDEAAWASPWRSRSVAERVALALGLGFWGLLAPTWWAALCVLALVIAIALLGARVPVRTYALALGAPWAFILIGVASVVIVLGHSADALFTVGPFQVTGTSLTLGGLVVTRACAVAAAIMLLATTCPMSELLGGMRRIGAPGVLVDIAASTYRMIFLLLDRAGAVRQAQASRLGYARAGVAIRSTGQLFATVFVAAWDRARRLEAGLDGRGGTGQLVALRPPNAPSRTFVAWTIVANLAAASLVILGWWFR